MGAVVEETVHFLFREQNLYGRKELNSSWDGSMKRHGFSLDEPHLEEHRVGISFKIHSPRLLWSFTMMKWISHERRIILQSSFLCHPINDHGIDHEAIAMRREKKNQAQRRFLSTAVLFHSSCFASEVRTMAIVKINLSWRHQNGRMLSTDGARYAASTNIPDRLSLN